MELRILLYSPVSEIFSFSVKWEKEIIRPLAVKLVSLIQIPSRLQKECD